MFKVTQDDKCSLTFVLRFAFLNRRKIICLKIFQGPSRLQKSLEDLEIAHHRTQLLPHVPWPEGFALFLIVLLYENIYAKSKVTSYIKK